MPTENESAMSGSHTASRFGGPRRFVRAAAIFVVATQLLACGEQVVGWPAADTSATTDTSDTGETVAPTVVRTQPLSFATGVSLHALVEATFSEPMKPATITDSTFEVTGPGGTAVDGLVAYSIEDRTSTFSPDTALEEDTTYTATVTTDATDLAGNALVDDYVWTFTTADPAIPTVPTVLFTAPADLESDVSVDASVQAVFSETMDPLTLTTSTFTVEDADGLVDGTVDPIDDIVKFTPDADLDPGTEYTATITADAAAPSGTPIADDYVWTFTTAFEPPTVIATDPMDQAIDVLLDTTVNATFSADMEPNTITDTSFLLTDLGTNDEVTAQVDYDDLSQTATLTPDAELTPLTSYRATVTTDASDLEGNSLASDYTWTFTTMESPLGLSHPFGIAATAGVTNTGATTINGDVVLDPNATCNAVTVGSAGTIGACDGFAPTVNGEVISPLYPDAGFTSGMVKADLRQAYIDFSPANMPPDSVIADGTTMGDETFTPGVYESQSSIMITGDLTLDAQGDSNAIFVFQSASTIGTAATGQSDPHTRILLVDGAQAANVYWIAGSAATLGTYTEFQGNILAYDDITMETGATSCGRLFAGASTDGAFVLDTNVVSVPGNCP